jgi:hypothetical protein
MLQLDIVISEEYDEETETFGTKQVVVLQLEHSLVSLSKWESQWRIPFLSSEDKTAEQTLSYVVCMILPGDYPPETFGKLTNEHFKAINDYINENQTATWVHEDGKPGPHEIVTAELIYYWMIALEIPFECQHWHLSRLLMLIKVCNAKNNTGKPKKTPAMSNAERRSLNAKRRQELGTKG